jgi:hypothetical protein
VSSPDETPIDSCESVIDKTTIFHIQLATSLIEGRPVGLEEVMGMIDNILRQHSIDKGKKMPYLGSGYQNRPP